MKLILPIFIILLLVACRPVKSTQQYYNDYVNPTASIDYENKATVDLPDEFLDDYYMIDSKIVRLAEQIDLLDSRIDDSWIDLQKSVNPWIKNMAFLDNDHLFLSGDDALGFDPEVRQGLANQTTEEKKFFISINNRAILVHVSAIGNKQFMTTLVECDLNVLAEEIPAHRTLIAFDKHIFGESSANLTEALVKLESRKKYSGQMQLDGKDWYWIRSMGSDNLVYLYTN
jgi:hypothetical protein